MRKVGACDGVMWSPSAVTGAGSRGKTAAHLSQTHEKHQQTVKLRGDTLSQLHRLAEAIQFSLGYVHVQHNRLRSRKGNRPLESNKPAGEV